jgi:hypothetical protein
VVSRPDRRNPCQKSSIVVLRTICCVLSNFHHCSECKGLLPLRCSSWRVLLICFVMSSCLRENVAFHFDLWRSQLCSFAIFSMLLSPGHSVLASSLVSMKAFLFSVPTKPLEFLLQQCLRCPTVPHDRTDNRTIDNNQTDMWSMYRWRTMEDRIPTIWRELNRIPTIELTKL